MKVLLTGRDGQVGYELERRLSAAEEVFATDRRTLDLANADAIRRVVRETRPDVVINAAAYTAVDQAESEPAAAMQVNASAPAILAEEARRLGFLLVHYSTDYVFDGTQAEPYRENDTPNPLNAYGLSKLKGEMAITASGCRHVVIRTSWVYGLRGRNFLLAILRAARQGHELRVVEDQAGAPTFSGDIADGTLHVLRATDAEGLLHMSAAGRTTWYGFAQAILRHADLMVPLVPISSAEYDAKARRPTNSLLNNSKLKELSGFALPDWQTALEQVMGCLRR